MTTKVELQKPFDLGSMNGNGVEIEFVANSVEMAQITDIISIISISHLKGKIRIKPWHKTGFMLTGELRATAVQECVVTLEPVTEDVVEPFGITSKGLTLRGKLIDLKTIGLAIEAPRNMCLNNPDVMNINSADLKAIRKIRKEDKETKKMVSVRKTNPLDPRLNRWQDTVNLPPSIPDPDDPNKVIPGSVTIRHRFEDFKGLFVLHCHILQHEDRGMMTNVLIVPDKDTDPQTYFDKVSAENKAINDKINQ